MQFRILLEKIKRSLKDLSRSQEKKAILPLVKIIIIKLQLMLIIHNKVPKMTGKNLINFFK